MYEDFWICYENSGGINFGKVCHSPIFYLNSIVDKSCKFFKPVKKKPDLPEPMIKISVISK